MEELLQKNTPSPYWSTSKECLFPCPETCNIVGGVSCSKNHNHHILGISMELLSCAFGPSRKSTPFKCSEDVRPDKRLPKWCLSTGEHSQ